MTVYFMGGEVDAWTPSDNNASDTSSNSFRSYNSSFCRGAIYSNDGLSYLDSADFETTLPDTFWCHFEYSRRFASSSYNYLNFYAGATAVLRFGARDTGCIVQAFISGSWTTIGSEVSASFGTDSLQTVDLYIEGNNASGAVKIYLAGTLRLDTTGDLGDVTGIDMLRFWDGGGGLSQAVLADEPTIGWRLITRHVNGNGATTDWTGDWSGIDEIPYADADFINSATNGQVEICTQTGPSLTGYVIRAVAVYARSRRGASGPANLQLALKSGATTYFSSSKAQDLGYLAYGKIWEQNPATSADFLPSQIDALQPGVKAIT